MNLFKHLLIVVLFLNFSCNSQRKKINGISFVATKDSVSYKNIEPLINLQSNYVALMPFGFMKNKGEPKIIFNSKNQWFGETPAGVKQYATIFNKDKIKLMIKPQIWVWKGVYTGLLEMQSEEDWQEFEESYLKFIFFYAKLAEELQADIFCIGTELEIFIEKRPVFWSYLIKQIKNVYKGKLTYAANWDEYKRVPFWNEVDFIGIDAYFPLSNKKLPSLQDLEQGWQPHKLEIKKIQNKHNIPILFTEFGYRSVEYNAKQPWNFNKNQDNVSVKAQEIALQAIFNQFWKEPWFAGGFLWKWFPDHKNSGGNNNAMFTPQNKPAEDLVRHWYK